MHVHHPKVLSVYISILFAISYQCHQDRRPVPDRGSSVEAPRAVNWLKCCTYYFCSRVIGVKNLTFIYDRKANTENGTCETAKILWPVGDVIIVLILI